MGPDEAREGWGGKPLFVTAVKDGAGGGEGGLGGKPLFVTAVTNGAVGGEGGMGRETTVCHSCDK